MGMDDYAKMWHSHFIYVLISYTKFLLVVSSVMYAITHLPSGNSILVWSVDANVLLLSVKFIVLFVSI